MELSEEVNRGTEKISQRPTDDKEVAARAGLRELGLPASTTNTAVNDVWNERLWEPKEGRVVPKRTFS